VNGKVWQDADLSELIWGIPEIISILSQSIALKRGDIIMTGTPAGVGPIVVGDQVTGGIQRSLFVSRGRLRILRLKTIN
jgi:fumarylpyruvate hydrolase